MIRRVVLGGARLAQRFVPVPPGSGVVLGYHLVGANTGSEVDLDLDSFLRHLDWLSAHTEVTSLEETLTGNRGQKPRVTLTFDDAFANFRELVWPELMRRNLPAMLYVPTAFIDGELASPLTGASLSACTWDDLRKMQAQGLSIGSHSHAHHNMKNLSAHEVERDLRRAVERLTDELGVAPADFCFPQAKYSRALLSAVGRFHERAVIGSGHHIRSGTNPLAIPRIPIRARQRTLAPLFRRGVWLEELLADAIRQFR